MACIINNCCDNRGHCLELTNGCLDSPLCKGYDGGWMLGNDFGLVNTGALLSCISFDGSTVAAYNGVADL